MYSGRSEGFIVEQKRVLPHVDNQNGRKAGNIPDLVQGYPVVGQSLAERILITDRPAHAADLGDADEISLPQIIAAEAQLCAR